jgi:hypothetical protein
VAWRALADDWAGAVIVAVIAWSLLVMTVANGNRQVGYTSGVWAYHVAEQVTHVPGARFVVKAFNSGSPGNAPVTRVAR